MPTLRLPSFLAVGEQRRYAVTLSLILFCAGLTALLPVAPALERPLFPFVHLGWPHFLANMFLLYIFGRMTEERLGAARFAALVVAFGYATNGIAMAVSGQLVVGASGIVMALAGLSITLTLRKTLWSVVEAAILASFAVGLAWSDLAGLFSNDSRSHTAHLVGAGLGFFTGLLISRFRKGPVLAAVKA